MLLEIANAFMAAPLEQAGWDIALRKMAERTCSARGQLVAFGHDNGIRFNRLSDEPEHWMEDFAAIDGGNSAVNWRIASVRPPLEVAFEHHYAAINKTRNSDIYDDFVQRYDVVNGCQTVLSHDSQGFFGLATLRTASDGPTTEEQRSLFANVAPFVLSAIKMQVALEHNGAALVTDAFNAMGTIAFLLDIRGDVVALTNAADVFLSRSDCPLRLSGKHLIALKTREDWELQTHIGCALREPDGHLSKIWLAGDHILDGHVCEAFQLPRREWTFGYEPRVLLVVRQVDGRHAGTASFLQRVMGLTQAEAEVANLVSQGLSRDQVAEQRGTSASTVHAQLKSVYHKAAVDREAELVALINRLLI